MAYLAWRNFVTPWTNAIAASGNQILAVVIMLLVFVFFLGCMGRSLGMNVKFDGAKVVVAIIAAITLIFKGFGWLVKALGRGIRGCYRGLFNLFKSFGMKEGKSRLVALLITSALVLVII